MSAPQGSAEGLRSWLWVPAESERKIDKSRASGAVSNPITPNAINATLGFTPWEKSPINQNNMPRKRSSGATDSSIVITAPHPAATITPVRINRV